MKEASTGMEQNLGALSPAPAAVAALPQRDLPPALLPAPAARPLCGAAPALAEARCCRRMQLKYAENERVAFGDGEPAFLSTPHCKIHTVFIWLI